MGVLMGYTSCLTCTLKKSPIYSHYHKVFSHFDKNFMKQEKILVYAK